MDFTESQKDVINYLFEPTILIVGSGNEENFHYYQKFQNASGRAKYSFELI